MLLLNAFTDKKNWVIAALAAAVIFLLLTNLSQCGQPCGEVVKRDTILKYDSVLVLVRDSKPVPKRVAHFDKNLIRKNQSFRYAKNQKFDTQIKKDDNSDSTIITERWIIGGNWLDSMLKPRYPILSPFEDSLRYYRDTFEQNQVKAVIEETTSGEILNRKVWLANLKPEITIRETRIKERWKVYAGAQVIVPNDLKRWGVAPSILLTIPKIGGISYSYDIRNQSHIAGIYGLIRIKK